MQRKLLGVISVDFDTTGQLLITYSAFVKYLRKMGIQWSGASAVRGLQLGGRSRTIFSLSLVTP